MTVNYVGMSKNYNYRIAEINFNEEKEQQFYNRLERIMRIKGWNLNQIVNGYALCEVENMSEYKNFVKDYKSVKKSIRLWNKYNI